MSNKGDWDITYQAMKGYAIVRLSRGESASRICVEIGQFRGLRKESVSFSVENFWDLVETVREGIKKLSPSGI